VPPVLGRGTKGTHHICGKAPCLRGVFLCAPFLACCRQDFAYSGRRSLLTLAEASFPDSILPLITLLAALCGVRMPADAAAAASDAPGTTSTDSVRCAQYVASYFNALPRYTQQVPLAIALHAWELLSGAEAAAAAVQATADEEEEDDDATQGLVGNDGGDLRGAHALDVTLPLKAWARMYVRPRDAFSLVSHVPRPTAALVLPAGTVGVVLRPSSHLRDLFAAAAGDTGTAPQLAGAGSEMDAEQQQQVTVQWRWPVSGFAVLLAELEQLLYIPARALRPTQVALLQASVHFLSALMRAAAPVRSAPLLRALAPLVAPSVDAGRFPELMLKTFAACARWALLALESHWRALDTAAAAAATMLPHEAAGPAVASIATTVLLESLQAAAAIADACPPATVVVASIDMGLLVASSGAVDLAMTDGQPAALVVAEVIHTLASSPGGHATLLAIVQWAHAVVARVAWPHEGLAAVATDEAAAAHARSVCEALVGFAVGDLLPSHHTWRYERLSHRFQLALALLQLVDDILQRLPVNGMWGRHPVAATGLAILTPPGLLVVRLLVQCPSSAPDMRCRWSSACSAPRWTASCLHGRCCCDPL